MDKILHDLKDSKLWNYCIFLIIDNAGFCPSTVGQSFLRLVMCVELFDSGSMDWWSGSLVCDERA